LQLSFSVVFEEKRKRDCDSGADYCCAVDDKNRRKPETKGDRALKIIPPTHRHPNLTPKKTTTKAQNQFPYRH
jgi:hypothetical protein